MIKRVRWALVTDTSGDRAVAAIKAMREPTEKMLEGGMKNLRRKPGWNNRELLTTDWRAMIDAALDD